MKKLRLSILIPLLLILSSLASSTLLFWQEIRTANRTIQQAGIDNLNTTLTHLQNMLNTQLAADNLEDAKLSLAVSTLHPGIHTLLLADENNKVMLANRNIWIGSQAAPVSGYNDSIAQQVRQTQASSVSLNASQLVGYYPVMLRIVAGGLGVNRVGVLFVEQDLGPQLAQARYVASVQAALFGGLMIAVAIAVALLLHRLISRRVEKIVAASKRFAAGDLDARVFLRGRDELAELGHAFDDMASQRKEAEEQLRRSEHSLAEAQRIAHLGNWDLDLVNNVLTWSNEIYRIFEIDPEKFGASYDAFLNAIHPDDREPVNNAYTESLKSKTPYDIVHRLLMKDGRVKYVNEKCETYYGEDGKPLRSAGTVHDITERKQAEDKVNELNRNLEQRVVERTAQLEAANHELEAFSYSVSHDLRTPLRAIDGFARILLDDYTDKLDNEGKRLLNVVRDNTSRMGQLIDDILKFSRVGRLEISYSEIDMEELTRAVCDELRPAMTGQPGHEVLMEIGSLPPSTGDRSMLRQVLVNLISNAIKFTRFKEGARIKVGSSITENEVIYFVQDNGVGFDMQYVDKLFGVFQRLHGVTEFEGTGIGLAIVKRVIARHGGRVWAEGKLNGGATIYFALPTKEKEHV